MNREKEKARYKLITKYINTRKYKNLLNIINYINKIKDHKKSYLN